MVSSYTSCLVLYLRLVINIKTLQPNLREGPRQCDCYTILYIRPHINTYTYLSSWADVALDGVFHLTYFLILRKMIANLQIV